MQSCQSSIFSKQKWQQPDEPMEGNMVSISISCAQFHFCDEFFIQEFAALGHYEILVNRFDRTAC
jgi:hypothetical protein